jgi:RHS repeat-associated protein
MRVGSSTTGSFLHSMAYAPFGELYAQGGSTWFGNFTAQGEYYSDFAYRRYATQGRWASPDPAGLAAANPQSWNHHAYVMNNPLALTDPSGLDPCQGANVFPFSQDDNGTGIFTQDDCIANGAPGATVFREADVVSSATLSCVAPAQATRATLSLDPTPGCNRSILMTTLAS